MDKLLYSLTIIISALFVGCSIRQLDNQQLMRLPMPIAELRKLLQKAGLLFFMPVSFMTAVWVVRFADLRVALLPLLGATALASGGIFGWVLARMTGAEPRRTGVLICCTSFTNIGAIGALVCYKFLGEAGFALVGLYKLFEEIIYYTAGFPIARHYSGRTRTSGLTAIARVTNILRDPFVAAVLTALVTGLALNLTGIPRPPLFTAINAIFIPVGTFVLITSIGLGMQFSRINEHLGYALAVTAIKVTAIPALVTGLAWAIGLGNIDHGLPLRVVFILSAMPVAFTSLIAASLYDLNLDLANSCWLISTLSLIVVLPWLYWLLRFF
jgi:predicted permease